MGNCTITIDVTGAHHNDRPTDIDQLAARFVDELQGHCHTVTHAAITSGSEQDLLDRTQRRALR